MTTRVTHVDSGCLQSLPLISTTLKSHIVDLTASHSLTQVYNNSSTRDIPEALYTFPLYESSSVTDFQALVGEKTISGVVKQRAEAKAIYEAAKSAGRVTALFSQDTSEVFTTSIGNIPAGGLVVVVIKYVHELKQDIEVDGVKLIIPTVIAPKYGNGPATTGLVFGNRWPTCWGNFSQRVQDIGEAEDAGLSLSITATMSGPIRGVTSPSHPISIGIGSHSSADIDFNPAKAHATLALASRSLTGLDKDFSLLIKVNNIGDPGAFLAPHPTLKDTSTLMVTMVPKFALPSQGHEIIFVVDRSGSMGNKIATVRSALQLFLSSLPVGLYFNICSFGSNHSFLWPQSQEYSEVSLNAAKAHVMGLDSKMGGTQILKAVAGAVKARRQDMRAEILILTDGEVWNAESLFAFINESSKDGNVRFFSLGVGDIVSHSLVEGIARAGKGCSQIVNIASGLQKKVMRMLKAALTPHVNGWDIGWAGKPEEQRAILTASAPRTVAPISLFDPNCDPDNTPFAPYSSALTLTLPKVIQAPTVVPGLFSYSRTTVYFLISNGDRPEKVFLKGFAHVTSSNTICPLQIEIPVHAITSTGASLGLYRLAGRKLLQDLEEGRPSYLDGIYDKAKEPAKHAELIAKEGTRIGLEFGLASKWTSFVAVEGIEATGEQGNQQEEERADALTEGETQTTNSGSASSFSRRTVGGGESIGGGQGSQEGERTEAPREGESQAANSGSPSFPSRRTSHSKSALGGSRAPKHVSASPRSQERDYTCQQQQLSRGGVEGFGAPSKVSGGGIVRGAYSRGPPPLPSPKASTQPGGASGHLVGGARIRGRSFGAAPKPSSKLVQAHQRRSSSKPISQDNEGLNLITETAALLAPPVGEQDFSSPISSPSPVSSSSLLGHKPSSPLGTLPASQGPVPASPRSATARHSVTSTSCSPTSPRQARYSSQGSCSPASPSRGPAPRPRACCAARGSHPPASPSHSPTPRTQVRYTAQGPRPMASPSRGPTPRPRACCAAKGSHPPAFPSYSPAPRPQVCPTVQDSHSPTLLPQVVCTPQDSCTATPPSHSPALQSQVYYIAQDPLGNFDLDPLTPGPEFNHQSSFPPAQHYQQQESQWIPEGSHNLVSDLASLPQSNGMFKADGRILAWLGLRNSRLENAHADADFLTTVAIIVALEEKFPELLEEWEFMVSKAKEAVQKLYPEGDREAVASAVRVALGV
ncbi:hypothetical protein HOY82DRAFT_563223 [Tuber indicum]|nr:hypothetical protein HOY82DRAFT_563223 [Tuber indicum]